MAEEIETERRLAMIVDMAETLAERLLTREGDWDDTVQSQRLTLMRVAILLHDMGCAIPDSVQDAIQAAEASAGRVDPSGYDAIHVMSAAEHAPN